MSATHERRSKIQPPALETFIRLFNDGHFFEAHEVLEDLWIVTTGAERDFYKGLIQYAVAFTHLSRKNFKGARSLHKRAAGYLKRYQPETEGVDVSRLMKETERFFREVASIIEKDPSIELHAQQTPKIAYRRATEKPQ